MQNRITKLHECPDCHGACDGKSCRCGWEREKSKHRSLAPRKCIHCNMPAVSGRMCEKHAEAAHKREHIQRLEGYLENATGTQRIAIENMISLEKYGKLAHEPKQEGAADDDRS